MKIYILCIISILVSCNNDQPTRYIVPHEDSETVLSLNPNLSPDASITYSAPSHWITKSPSNMVLASFFIGNKTNSAALTVLKFPGQTGGLLQNVNRWLNQLELDSIQLSQLNQYVENGETSKYNFQRVTITNTTTQQSMIVFIIRDKNYSWFFKMLGDLELVVSEESNFTNFINSVRLP